MPAKKEYAPLTDEQKELAGKHVGLAKWMAARHLRAHPNDDEDETISECLLGVVNAARTFDPSRGCKFCTHARWWMWSALSGSARAKKERHVPARRWSGHSAEGVAPDLASVQWPDEDDETLSLAAARKRARLVREAVRRLPEPHRSVARGFFFDGKTMQDIGREHRRSHCWVAKVKDEALDSIARRLVGRLPGPAA